MKGYSPLAIVELDEERCTYVEPQDATFKERDRRLTELQELKGIIRRTIHVRRVTLSIFFAVALSVRLFLEVSFALALLLTPLIWFLMTFPFKYLIEGQREEAKLHWAHAGFFIFEVLIITYLIHLMEGVEWIGIIFYLFTIIYANFFLPKLQGYLITGLAILLYSLLVTLEYSGLIPHRQLFVQVGYQSLSYTMTTLLAGAVGIYAALAYTIRIFADIYSEKNRRLSERERELELLSSRLISAQEEERRLISRELHDEVGQALSVVKMNLDIMERDFDDEQLTETGKLVDQTLEKVRGLSHSLRPPMLDELGLIPTLRWLADRFEETKELKIALHIEGLEEVQPTRLSPQVESLLYRLTQESLNNVVKHAQATEVAIHLQRESDTVKLEIEDDGRGFDVDEALSKSSGLGLRGMREQVTLARGRFNIRSKEGEGTKISLEIRLEEVEPL